MEQLDLLLTNLAERHRKALQWFIEHTGAEVTWPQSFAAEEGDTMLASRAKGIYKPQWSKYALSVRASLDSPYPNREPITRDDGTWVFSYFQENKDPAARDSEYTNRGLLECWHDTIPIGVMKQTKRTPKTRYQILGVAIVAGWDGGYFFLEGFAPDGRSQGRGPGGEIEILGRDVESGGEPSNEFNPASAIDSRRRVIAQIIRRQGQTQFRQTLLQIYGGRCAISECDATDVLEAAHISPYLGPETNHPTNGVLLRADIHTLFDLGLLAIDCRSLTVVIHPKLIHSSYKELAGENLRLPLTPAFRPSLQALQLHREWSGF
jgi:putative restriction endonuclease